MAEHCVNCYKEAKIRGYLKQIYLGCLLHDASESYISDLTRPVKYIKDNIIDALCLAITGMLGYKNGLRTILGNLMKDRRGLFMQMFYADKI